MTKLIPLLLAGLAAQALAKNPKLAPELDGSNSAGNRRVLVRYRSAPTAAQHSRAAARGAALKENHDSAGVSVYELPAANAAALAADPDVLYVSPDRPVRAALDYMPATIGANIALQYGFDGDAIGVAVIDSGIAASSDLTDARGRSRVVYSENFLPLCSSLPATRTDTQLAAMSAESFAPVTDSPASSASAAAPGEGCVT